MADVFLDETKVSMQKEVTRTMELEKKYLIRSLPMHLETYDRKQIEQGYLCKSPVVRIRKSNDRYILTYKARKEKAESGEQLCVNEEIEMPLTQESYEHLREKTDGCLIRKCRYLIPLEDGHTGELDIFEGGLQGLVFIEVEFADEEDAESFVPPDWFGENVSGDRRYSNSFLSGCKDLSVFDGMK